MKKYDVNYKAQFDIDENAIVSGPKMKHCKNVNVDLMMAPKSGDHHSVYNSLWEKHAVIVADTF